MATTHQCDRCGWEVEEPTWFVALKQSGVYPHWLLLCEQCKEQYEQWYEQKGKYNE